MSEQWMNDRISGALGTSESHRVDQIPRELWDSDFRAFSRSHEGWLASLNVFEREGRAQALVRDVPFEGISLDRDSIVLTFAVDADARFTHVVDAPERVLLELGDDRSERALVIQSPIGR